MNLLNQATQLFNEELKKTLPEIARYTTSKPKTLKLIELLREKTFGFE